MRKGSKDARRRATIDLVMHHQKDADLNAAKKLVIGLQGNGTPLGAHPAGSPEYKAILDVLNAYEFVASGIRQGAFDEDVYKRVFCSMLTRDWKALAGFVLEIRNRVNKPTLFQDFEELAQRWDRKPLKANK
ncbi:hypothetical protein BZY94_06385 [Burkholderia territorii]|nr:hypothetical protein BZY94_06385 [Burkholderia territorii]